MKRFIDDQIWLDPWFSKLSSDHKILWIYLFTNCSKIGEWEINTEEVEYRLKKKLDWEKVKTAFTEKVFIIGNKWYIKNFIAIQYPRLLISSTAPLHVAVFRELDKKGLKLAGNSLYIDYAYTMDSLQVKVRYSSSLILNSEDARDESLIPEQPKPAEKTWRNDFETYLADCTEGFKKLFDDPEYISDRQEYHPGLNIKLTMKKAYKDFWSLKSGWENKKSNRATENICWKSTINSALTFKSNQVWEERT
jgi:hypothetical protein